MKERTNIAEIRKRISVKALLNIFTEQMTTKIDYMNLSWNLELENFTWISKHDWWVIKDLRCRNNCRYKEMSHFVCYMCIFCYTLDSFAETGVNGIMAWTCNFTLYILWHEVTHPCHITSECVAWLKKHITIPTFTIPCEGDDRTDERFPHGK